MTSFRIKRLPEDINTLTLDEYKSLRKNIRDIHIYNGYPLLLLTARRDIFEYEIRLSMKEYIRTNNAFYSNRGLNHAELEVVNYDFNCYIMLLELGEITLNDIHESSFKEELIRRIKRSRTKAPSSSSKSKILTS